MNNAKKYLLKLIIVAVALVLADKLIGRWLTHAYFHISHGEQGRITYAIDSTTAPLLILGSSRAVHHYIPGIFTDSFHMDCYNTGKDNEGLYYCLAILTADLQRYHPQTILLDLTPNAFVLEENILDRLSVLLPYYHSHPEIRPILDKRSPGERWKTLSTLYCYNSLVLQTLGRSTSEAFDQHSSNGYLPIYDTISYAPSLAFDERWLTDPVVPSLVDAFEKIIALARQDQCKLAVIMSPSYYPLPHGSTSLRLAKDICQRNGITFLDYTWSPTIADNRQTLFYDGMHLNDAGAQRFTRLLCSDLIAKGFPKSK